MGQRSVFWLLLVTFGCLLVVAPPATARQEISGKASVFVPGGDGSPAGRGPDPGGDDPADPDDPFELDRVLAEDGVSTSTVTWQTKWLNRFVLQLLWMSRVIR